MIYTILGVIAILATTTYTFLSFHPTFGAPSAGVSLERIQNAENFRDGQFTNIYPVKENFGWEDYKKMLKKQFKGNKNKTPETQFPQIEWDNSQLISIPDSVTTAIWYGHSSIFLRMNGLNILIDPVYAERPSPIPSLGPKRFSANLPIAIAELPVIDVILLSHDHYDHLDYNTIKVLKDKTSRFIAPLGVGAHLERWGVDPAKITELYWGENTSAGGITFSCTPAQHFSGRGFSDKFKTLWCSWVIDGNHKVFFSGDSGYFDGFKKIGDEYGPFDACFMECGQYDSLWQDIHMFPEQTAQAHLALRGESLIPIHWGGFALANHDWDDPISRLSAACSANGVNLSTPMIGEAITIGSKQMFSDWWRRVASE